MNTLSKTSTNSEIKDYFSAVLKLTQSNEAYPINLDEVWPLVYSAKNKAVEALKRDFIEGDDFKLINRKVEQVSGAKYVDDYFLTVSCLEYFIVKKVRPVFEVYRQVFHHTANKSLSRAQRTRSTSLSSKVRASLVWVKGVKSVLNLNDSSTLQMLKQIADPLGLPTPDYTASKGVLKAAGRLLKEHDIKMSAQAFNQKMIDKGFMVELSRPSSKGVKKFKSLTETGLGYGENQVNPGNPKETQPLYYVDRFKELLAELG